MAERAPATAVDAESAVLVIDTASPAGLAAVVRGERTLAEVRWTLETTFSRELLARVDEALDAASLRRSEVAALVVNTGPGAYTGLRVGVATAQGLALALDAPLAGVQRLEADAFPHLPGGGPVVAVHDAGRGRVAWAAYAAGTGGDGVPATLVAPRMDEPDECTRAAPAPATWCGELSDELRSAWVAPSVAARRSGDREAATEANVRHGADFVRLAHLHRAFGDPASVDVLYLRPPSITAPRPRKSARPAAQQGRHTTGRRRGG